MNIIKWLKLEFYNPQRNKALKKVAYYNWSVKRYEKMISQGKILGRKDDGRFGYHRHMGDVWQLELEQLEFKILQIERS